MCINQRERLLSPGTIAWFTSRLCNDTSSGRAIRVMPAIHINVLACRAKKPLPGCSATMSTMRPRKSNIATSTSANSRPAISVASSTGQTGRR
ncbi:hypothetical protein D3C71_1985860 [compost metagenome]